MTYVNFKKLKDRVSLTRILEHYGLIESLSETTQGYEGVCPICGSDAFKANTEKNAWFCFGECKEKEEKNGGNILDLVASIECVSVKKAAGLIAEWFPEKQEENVAQEQKVTETPSEEVEGVDEGQGGTLVSTDPKNPVTGAPVKPISPLTENKPLTFTLKGVNPEHPLVAAAGIHPDDATEYGVGYFEGKGSMHERIVFPFQNEDGEVLGYAGYLPKDGSWKYPPPEKFNPELELFGYRQAHFHSAAVVLCRDPLAALRHKGRQPQSTPVAVVSTHLTVNQLILLEKLVEPGNQILFGAPYDDEAVAEFLAELLPRYYVRLVRY